MPQSSQPRRRVGIIQSNYIPWKGYFDFIHLVDQFVLFDDVQFTRRDWRNRNRVKTRQGAQWLTIPVSVTGKYHQKIQETEISDPRWADTHWKTLAHHYARTPFFRDYEHRFEELYLGSTETMLSAVNHRFIVAINEILGIDTPIRWSSEIPSETNDPSARLLAICTALGATEYVSGPAARNYLQVEIFQQHGIDVSWMDYGGYPEYPQLHPPFAHGVTILDLIFNTGPEAVRYLKTFAHDRVSEETLE